METETLLQSKEYEKQLAIGNHDHYKKKVTELSSKHITEDLVYSYKISAEQILKCKLWHALC